MKCKLLVMGAVALSALSMSAQTWDKSKASGDWSNGSNWVGGTAPSGDSSEVKFDSSSSGISSYSINLDSDVTVKTLSGDFRVDWQISGAKTFTIDVNASAPSNIAINHSAGGWKTLTFNTDVIFKNSKSANMAALNTGFQASRLHFNKKVQFDVITQLGGFGVFEFSKTSSIKNNVGIILSTAGKSSANGTMNFCGTAEGSPKSFVHMNSSGTSAINLKNTACLSANMYMMNGQWAKGFDQIFTMVWFANNALKFEGVGSKFTLGNVNGFNLGTAKAKFVMNGYAQEFGMLEIIKGNPGQDTSVFSFDVSGKASRLVFADSSSLSSVWVKSGHSMKVINWINEAFFGFIVKGGQGLTDEQKAMISFTDASGASISAKWQTGVLPDGRNVVYVGTMFQ